jgi:hypothetical protein
MDGDADLVGKQRGELEGEGAKHAWSCKYEVFVVANTKCEMPFVSYICNFNFF